MTALRRGRMWAFCHSDGVVRFARRSPDGVWLIANGGRRRIRREMEAVCRRGHDGALLVPGMPEAETQDDAFAALERFIARAGARAPETGVFYVRDRQEILGRFGAEKDRAGGDGDV